MFCFLVKIVKKKIIPTKKKKKKKKKKPRKYPLDTRINPKGAGLFEPISQPGGGADSAPQDLGNRLTKHQVCGTSG